MVTDERSRERRARPRAWRNRLSDFGLRNWTIVVAMAVWLWLNAFDLLITYDGLAAGAAYEANRFMSGIMRWPVLAVSVKMSLALVMLKLVERIEVRRPFSGLAPLLAANVYLGWACLHNLHVLTAGEDWSNFLRYYPLAGLPR